jgi:hypothetical protein
MCRIFKEHRLWERAEAGEFRIDIQTTRMDLPFVDHKGQTCVWSDEVFLLDDQYPRGHHRHEVVRGHRFRLEDGSIGASGMLDPKAMMIIDTNYRGLKHKKPACQLCEQGDMIAPAERFHGSKYRPTG